jgi:toxin secretion/phage lysis holin
MKYITIISHKMHDFDFLIAPKYLFVGVLLQPVLMLFERYIFADWQFLFFLMVLMGIDTITGFIKHWLAKSISEKAFGKVAKKVVVYFCYLIVMHVITHYTDKPEARYVFGWVEQVGYAVLITREALSIITNLDAIHPGIIPGWFKNRLQKFHDTGKMEANDAQG